MIHGHRLKAVKPNVDNLQSNEVTKFPHIKKKELNEIRTPGANRVFSRNDIQASAAALQ
jgi:hypothetical protein